MKRRLQTAKRLDPLFVLEDARSGTTYLSSLLIQHKDIGMTPESNLVVSLLRAYGSQTISQATTLGEAFNLIDKEDKFRDWKILPEEVLPLLENCLPMTIANVIRTILMFYCEREFPGCIVWGIKKGYIASIWELVEHFPQARFIHIVCDGRAVFSSKKKALHTQTGRPFEENPLKAAGRWIRLIQTFRNFSQKHPAHCLEISYEKLVAEPLKALSAIFHFLEVADVEIDLQRQASYWIPERYRYLHPNVGKPPRTANIDSWKQQLTSREIQEFEAIARYELGNHGYALVSETQRSSFPVLIYKLKQLVKGLRRPRSLMN